MDMNIYQSKNK